MTDRQPIDFIGQLAPDFVDRLREQEEILKTIRGRVEPFILKKATTKGDYSIRTLVSSSGNFRLENPDIQQEILSGIELNFSQLIRTFLKSAKKPIVIMDVGGMMGLSWCRLANRYKEHVESGKIIFVVTNISFDSKSEINSIRLTDNERMFVQRNMHLVHYINGDSSNLDKAVVKTQHGDVELINNVDIVNESLSVTKHSQVPEWDIPRIVLPLLSPCGLYFTQKDCLPSEFFGDDKDNYLQRQEGIKYSRSNLIDQGLTLVRSVEEGRKTGELLNYAVFRKPLAPRIKVN